MTVDVETRGWKRDQRNGEFSSFEERTFPFKDALHFSAAIVYPNGRLIFLSYVMFIVNVC